MKTTQTYHISENNSSQPIDVYVLQKSVWILLKKEDKFWRVSCTSCFYVKCFLQHERARAGVLVHVCHLAGGGGAVEAVLGLAAG